MGIDWWIERVSKNGERIKAKLEKDMQQLNRKMNRFPGVEIAFLDAITQGSVPVQTVIFPDGWDFIINKDFYMDIMRPVYNGIQNFERFEDLVKGFKKTNVQGGVFPTFWAFYQFFKKLLKKILEKFEEGKYYIIISG